MKKLTQEQVITRFRSVHGDKFDYSKTTYKGDSKKVTVICNAHGAFKTWPHAHYHRKVGCPKCHFAHLGDLYRLGLPAFIKAVEKKFGKGRFDFSKAVYKEAQTKIILTCNLHKRQFTTTPWVFIRKRKGCPSCSKSRSIGEQTIFDLLKAENLEFKHQHCVKINGSKHYFDFYIPCKNLIVEFNGIQHYIAVPHFGGEEGLINVQTRDAIKQQYCKENNIKFLTIKYDQIEQIPTLLEKVIP